MNRIFYIHSNILKICCYQTVKESIERGENVTIITTRGSSWDFFKDKVEVWDFTKIFGDEDKQRMALHSIRGTKDYLRHRRFLSHLKKVISEIVNNEDFILYLPSMAMVQTAFFAHNKYCKGYYYVDEGRLAYTHDDDLRQYVPNTSRNRIKKLFGIEDYYHYEITSSFKGTVSITNDSFAWNEDKEKIVNPIGGFIEEVKNDIPYFDDVILTSYLSQELEVILNSIDFTIDNILKIKPESKIGVKLHPQAIYYNKDAAMRVMDHINDKYPGIVTLIPVNVSIEVMSVVYNPVLYALLQLSSVIMYALLFKSSDTKLVEENNGTITIRNVATMEEYYNISFRGRL